MKTKRIFVYAMLAVLALAVILLVACSLLRIGRAGERKETSAGDGGLAARFVFDADSAYSYCAAQCSFGPRVMNSAAHDACGEWIKDKFAGFGLEVESQRTRLRGWDGTWLECENITARYNPGAERRILICAHWDSRPWADNDPDEANRRTPVMAANDGASGVAVMLELARVLETDSAGLDAGVDFICFDAEDYGLPQWVTAEGEADTWALGAQYWAGEYAARENAGEKAFAFGILLDMVGGEGAVFYKEGMSERYAPDVVERVWKTARRAGYGSAFPSKSGTYVTDDHIPVNEKAGIKCIDIIPYYPDCPQSSFGPTWHTVDDTMEHISASTLKAVGQTLAALLEEY